MNLMLTGAARSGEPADAPLEPSKDWCNTLRSIATAHAALVGGSQGAYWHSDYVFSGGNLVLDLLHNFFLEKGARLHKIHVYEMTKNPVAREMIGYLLVRGARAGLCHSARDTYRGGNQQDATHPDDRKRQVPRTAKVRRDGLPSQPLSV